MMLAIKKPGYSTLAPPSRRASGGFTLIELMIVVAIIGIIAAIAYPSYQDQVTKTRRMDAQGALSGFASAMERYYTENGTYKGAGAGGGDTGAPTIFPDKAPLDGSNKYYDLKIAAADRNTYELRAVPIAGSAQAGDGAIRLKSTGEKEWDKGGSGTWVTWNE